MWDVGGTISLLADALEAEPPAEAQREEAFQALERAMRDRTEEAVQTGLALARAWLARRPDDWTMRDAGEPVAMLADALEIVAREAREEKAREMRDAPAVAAQRRKAGSQAS